MTKQQLLMLTDARDALNDYITDAKPTIKSVILDSIGKGIELLLRFFIYMAAAFIGATFAVIQVVANLESAGLIQG